MKLPNKYFSNGNYTTRMAPPVAAMAPPVATVPIAVESLDHLEIVA